MMGPGEWNPLPLARIQTDHFAPCYSCHGSYTAITPPYHNHDYILPQMWLQLLRPETAMSIMADGYNYDATVTLCPRPLQLFQIQAFLLPLPAATAPILLAAACPAY